VTTDDRYQDLPAERSLVGCALFRSDAIREVDLAPEDLADPRLRVVWEAMLALDRRGVPIDAVTLEAELAGGGKLVPIGGHAFLAELVADVPTADNIAHYADIVADRALQRRVRQALRDALSARHETGEEALSALCSLAGMVRGPRKEQGALMRDVIRQTFADLQEAEQRRARGEPPDDLLQTGFHDLDQLTGGFTRGALTLVGARPGMGKSAFLRQVADHVASGGGGVHYFSLEDRNRDLARRAIADRGNFDVRSLRTLEFRREEFAAMTRAADALHRCDRWFIDDTKGLSAAELVRRARRRMHELGTRLVVVDYVQCLSGRERDELERITNAVTVLSDFAGEENVVVLVASQLNRGVESREDKRPQLNDLRASGELEQRADMVLMLYRADYYDPDTSPGEAEVLVRKHKNGVTGTVQLNWSARSTAFRNVRYGMREAG
jgi:replicative DNA helicase